jgi:hypothetical protein
MVGTRSLYVKVHQEKKNAIKKNSTLIDRESDYLSIVEFFFLLRFLFGLHFYIKTPASEFNQGHSTMENH